MVRLTFIDLVHMAYICLLRVSATNCANIYLAKWAHVRLPVGWSFTNALQQKHVSESFKLLSLLEHSIRISSPLTTPHTAPNERRLDEAMEQRNKYIREFGQPELRHTCSRCCRRVEGNYSNYEFLLFRSLTRLISDRLVYTVVCDGITLGRPCCSSLRCPEPLASNKDRFCPLHRREDDICCIAECHSLCEPGRRTCDNPVHRNIEDVYTASGTALFQLRARLKRSRVSHPTDSLADGDAASVLEIDGDGNEEFEVTEDGEDGEDGGVRPVDEGDMDGPIDASPNVKDHLSTEQTKLSKKVRSRFGRARTHNEEIIVAPCGMVLARRTMYHAEAISEVAVRLHPFCFFFQIQLIPFGYPVIRRRDILLPSLPHANPLRLRFKLYTIKARSKPTPV
jgi:hypothetical protein